MRVFGFRRGARLCRSSQLLLHRALSGDAASPTLPLAWQAYRNPHTSDTDTAARSPLVVMHGLLGSAVNWSTVMRRKEFSGRPLFGVDLRNHGHSPHSDNMTLEDMSADLIRFLDDRALPGATVLGHSLGGLVGMVAALRNPHRVDRLIVADIAPIAYDTTRLEGVPAVLRAMATVRLDAVHSRHDADAQLLPLIPDKMVRSFVLQNLEVATPAHGTQGDERWRWRVPLPLLIRSLHALLRFDFEGLLADVGPYDGPALFVIGGRSSHVPDSAHAFIRRLFPHARLQTVPDAGHWVHAERPKMFSQIVGAFLRDTEPA